MFKFFQRSPKPSTKPSASPTPPPPPSTSSAPPPPPSSSQTRPDAQQGQEQLHGLGLSVPDGADAILGQLPGGRDMFEEGEREVGRSKSPAAGTKDATAARRTSASRRASTVPAGGGGTSRRGSEAAAVGELGERTTSPLSFSPSVGSSTVGFRSPYGGGGSLGALSERDPSRIYAPTTWSEMANQELVVNVSARERTRQEILWEVVASEERYVAELRSFVELYANPLLHPLLSSSTSPSPPLPAPSPFLSPSSPPPAFSSPTPSSNFSSPELPIAARFARSNGSLASSTGGRGGPYLSPSPADIPEIDDSDTPPSAGASKPARKTGFLGRSSLPVLPTGARQNPSTVSLDTTLQPQTSVDSSYPASAGQRLAASFGFGSSTSAGASSSARHPLRPAPSSAKLHKSAAKAPAEAKMPPPLPEAVKQCLEAVVEMLRGHEELSARLKERWAKDFPLVRGLAAIWSDQPWFLQTYATYIVSLEESLSTLDTLLPSAHSPALSSYAARFKSPKSRGEKDDKKLAKLLMGLEEKAAEAGESSLSICLSKPLMRLSKLPLLMQALLYHTDPTTHEWEKTRAMALEVDALVRSIEDEKIEEEERERTRDILARIDGINDKALMAPRSSRVVIEEVPDPNRSTAPSRSRTGRKSSGTTRSTADDWLIRFTDVVIRVQKIGQTNIPGSFSREKEKQGKQGKTRKTGKLRNTYRFIRVERWELREAADAALTDMDDMRRAIEEGEDGQRRRQSAESEDGDSMEVESRMSFRYDTDEPQPSSGPRDFSALRASATNLNKKPGLRSSPLAPTTAKFGTRLRVGSEDASGGMRMTSPVNRHRFDSPTVSSQLKTQLQTGATGGAGGGRRAASSPADGAGGAQTQPAPPRTVPPPVGSAPAGMPHARDESTFGLYQIWSAQDPSS
ncbi:hypothetical protein JCM6882_000966 [Rhodosporidiobolus microsporus]